MVGRKHKEDDAKDAPKGDGSATSSVPAGDAVAADPGSMLVGNTGPGVVPGGTPENPLPTEPGAPGRISVEDQEKLTQAEGLEAEASALNEKNRQADAPDRQQTRDDTQAKEREAADLRAEIGRPAN